MNNTKAFSLIELLICISFVAAMFLIAVPYWGGFVKKNQVRACADELTKALQFARAVAIRNNEPAKFCGSSDFESCNDSWNSGAIVIAEKSKRVIRVFASEFSKCNLTWHGNFGKRSSITFLPSGFPDGQHGSVYCCPKDSAEYALSIILSSTGRLRISQKTADGEIIPCNL